MSIHWLYLKSNASFLDGFSQNAILFAENLSKTLKQGSLHEKLLVLAKPTRMTMKIF